MAATLYCGSTDLMNRPDEPDIARVGGRAGQERARGALRQLASSDDGFELSRWFSIPSLVAITVLCVGFALVMTPLLSRELLRRDAALTGAFVASLAETQIRLGGLGGRVTLSQVLDDRIELAITAVDRARVAEMRNAFYQSLDALPEARLVSVFARDKRIIWSTNPSLRGLSNEANAELAQAFNSEPSFVDGRVDSEARPAQGFDAGEPARYFVQDYVPLHDAQGEIVAVVEVYKEPPALAGAVRRIQYVVWAGVAVGGVLLYLVLAWLMRRAQRMAAQGLQRRTEAETLALIGEMSATVAQALHGPLAYIRNSAEAAAEAEPLLARRNARDIVCQVDRLGKWMRELLAFSRPLPAEREPVDLKAALESVLESIRARLETAGITLEFVPPASGVPRVHADRTSLETAFACLINNAIDAMSRGGRLKANIVSEGSPGSVQVVFADSGAGMSAPQIESAFKPFYTTRKDRLGLGLVLARRIVQRYGGTITVRSTPGYGTEVILSFEAA